MSGVKANCPSCGGQVTFRIDSSFVTICDYCSSAVARGDRGLEDRGRVVDLIDSQSPLDLWLAGRYGESRFEIVGRTQIRHAMGGVWDEWYCAFDSGHWGWLAEAQGRYYMSFRSELPNGPAYDSLTPGQRVPAVADGELVVTELGQAQILGAKGEIPYLLEPGAQYHYADLSGPAGAFATLDYGDGHAQLYLGKEVTLDDLGIAISAPAREEQGTQVSASALECPNCRGALELVAPDQCERVACPYCGALSDVNQGNLQVLQILEKGRFPNPPLALGSKGVFEEHEMLVCGYMVRSTSWDGELFYWDEYLLYNPRVGFRWLVASDGHWSYVEPVNAADVDDSYHSSARYDGRIYRAFDTVSSQVEFVLGQFYWNVEIGERVSMRDYTSPPYSLSEERTDRELHWSRSTYVPVADIRKKFGVELDEPTPGTTGLNQPYGQRGVYKLFGVLVACAVAMFVFGSMRNTGKTVFEQKFDFAGASKSESQVQFSESFELQGGHNLEVEAYSFVNNSWVYAQFDLINEDTGAATFFALPIEYYSGADWSEGSTTSSTVLGALDKGTYSLRLAVERKDWRRPVNVQVKIREGVMRFRYLFALIGFLFFVPLLTFLHHRSFERRRWSDASEPAPMWAKEIEGE